MIEKIRMNAFATIKRSQRGQTLFVELINLLVNNEDDVIFAAYEELGYIEDQELTFEDALKIYNLVEYQFNPDYLLEIVDNLSKLRKIRTKRNLSQAKLSDLSGVNLRAIQDYEQGHKDINKAAGITLYKLAQSLRCNIEDLLEVDSKPVSNDSK